MLLDRDLIHRKTQPLCDDGFSAYVGRDRAGSAFVIFPVAPDPETWLAGNRRTICLVARSDGQWMDHAARGSGE